MIMYKSLTSQKKLKDYVRKKIDAIGICSSIKKYHPEEWDLFIYLFKRHSDYPQKFDGLIDISIRYNPVFTNQLETIIIKDNGDEDDVSVLNNCITGKPKDNLTIAMRNSILSQILEFRINNSLICKLCKSIKNIEIDHFEPQFIELKTTFLDNWNGIVPINFEQNKSHSKIFITNDINFENEWNKYHRKNARLRVLCKKCNSSREKIRHLNIQRCKNIYT